MRRAAGFLLRIFGVIAACLATDPLWHRGLYATACVLVVGGLSCVVSLVMAHLKLAGRVSLVEPSVVRTEDRERLRNRALLDHAPVPLLFQRPDGSLHVANRAARKLFATEDRMTDPPPLLLEALRTRDATGDRCLLRLGPGRDGSPARVYALSVGHGSGIGGITNYLALTDVEAGLNAAEAQALRTLLQVLSHEIMNSLTPIVSLSASAEDLVADAPSDELHATIAGALATIRRRAEGLDRFVRAYRDLARLPAPNPKPVELDSLLHDTARLFTARWGERLRLELSAPASRVIVRLDKAQIEQALMNLLNNGAEAALVGPNADDPAVRMAAIQSGASLTLSVSDNGPGVEASLRNQIFQPFVSFKPDGNGIGLSLSRQIALAHGGALFLDDARVDGPWRTVFSLRI